MLKADIIRLRKNAKICKEKHIAVRVVNARSQGINNELQDIYLFLCQIHFKRD